MRVGSVRHLLQAWWRALTDLRRPTRLLMLGVAVGSACVSAAGLGASGWWLGLVAGCAIPTVLTLVGIATWVRERRRATSRPGFPPPVSSPERPARRTSLDS